MRRNPRALTQRNVTPFARSDPEDICRCARTFEGAFVLFRTVEMERKLVVERNFVKLTGGLVLVVAPSRAAVDRHRRAPVVPLEKNLRVAWIYPNYVAIAVPRAEETKCSAAIGGFIDTIHHRRVGDVWIGRIGEDFRIVEPALTQFHFIVGAPPTRSRIIRSKNPAVARLNGRINNARIAGCYGHTDLSEHSSCESAVVRNLRPVCAGVVRLVEAAARTAARELPWNALRLPQRGIYRFCVVRVDRHINTAGVRVDEQYLAPRFPAISRLEDTAFCVRFENMTHCRHVDDIGIVRIDRDAFRDMCVGESGIRPRFSGIGRFVQTGAAVEIDTNRGVASSGVDDVHIGRCNC